VTGQGSLDSYADAGVTASVDLVNELLVVPDGGRLDPDRAVPAIAKVLAVDPPSVAQLSRGDAPGFMSLARHLHRVFAAAAGGDIDAAAERLNDLLARHSAHPHLAKEQGRWRLHHHPADAALVPMWTAICAEALARVISAGLHHRLGTCQRSGCGRVYFDTSKNGSRRFCSTTCQNRVKAAAFRHRRAHPVQ
jgi:predicted RNA-binding Zn ribbon-like protein